METPNTLQGGSMKFVIKGRTFDTANSKTVAVSRGVLTSYEHDVHNLGYAGASEVRYENVLYETAKGALFVHQHASAKYDRGKPVVTDSAFELTPAEAVKWIEKEEAAVVDAAGLPLPDEA